MRTSRTAGFTFIEVLLVTAILVTLAAISTLGLQKFYRSASHKVATQEIYSAFTDTRNSTLGSEGDTVFGVHVTATSVTRFVGDTYNAVDPSNEEYIYEGNVTAVGSLVTTGDIVFRRLTGEPSTSGSISVLNEAKTSTNTITVYASGLIE